MRKIFKTVPLAAALCLLAASPALAQRGAPITQGATTADVATSTTRLQSTTADLQVKVGSLQTENARLNGKVETLEFLLSQTRDEINRMQGDDAEIGRQLGALNRRLDDQARKISELEASATQAALSPATASTVVTQSAATTNPAVTSGGPRIVTQAQTPTETETETAATNTSDASPAQTGSLGTISASSLPGEAGPLFADAKSKLLQFNYAGAERAFRAFLDQFGDDPQAGEAQYWLGEVLYQQDAFGPSGAAYTHMIQTYPNDPRAPDALVKLARSLRLVGDQEKACAALDALPKRYPNASGVTNNLAAVERSRSACAT
ncbi:MAG: tol-pal system protein YbgF [Hyphomonadaceae bacterium]